MTTRFSSTLRARGALLAGGALLTAGILLAVGTPAVAASAFPVTSADEEPDVSVTVPPPPPASPPPNNPGASTPIPQVPPAANAPPGSAPQEPPAGGASGSAVCVPAEPVVPAGPADTGTAAQVDKDVYPPGEKVTVTAAGYGAEEKVQYVLFSEPKVVGTVTASATGAVVATFTVPEKSPNGRQIAQLTGWCGTIAKADVLIGRATKDKPMGLQAVPTWGWWVAGTGGAAALVVGGRQIAAVMRRPEETV